MTESARPINILLVEDNADDAEPTLRALPGYWVGLVLLVALGGLAAWIGKADNFQSAMAMGFGAPELISRLIGSDRAEIHSEATFPLRRWWGG